MAHITHKTSSFSASSRLQVLLLRILDGVVGRVVTASKFTKLGKSGANFLFMLRQEERQEERRVSIRIEEEIFFLFQEAKYRNISQIRTRNRKQILLYKQKKLKTHIHTQYKTYQSTFDIGELCRLIIPHCSVLCFLIAIKR
jgi:hypothetical protein